MTGKIFFYILCIIIGMEELKIKEGTRAKEVLIIKNSNCKFYLY